MKFLRSYKRKKQPEVNEKLLIDVCEKILSKANGGDTVVIKRNRLGISKGVASHIFGYLRKKGIISPWGKRRVWVVDIPKLKELVAEIQKT